MSISYFLSGIGEVVGNIFVILALKKGGEKKKVNRIEETS